mgnify:CR=1 FL=1
MIKGPRRELLAVSRGEIEVMEKVLAEKRCRPDGSTPDILIEVVRLAGGNAAIVDKSAPGKTFAEMGVASCDGVREDASAQDHLDQGRKLVATDQYPGDALPAASDGDGQRHVGLSRILPGRLDAL